MNRDSISLRQLRYFVAVCESSSFTRASRALNVAQSALSHHVAQLETEFGTQLLIRTGRGVVPTSDGERLASHAREVLSAMDRFHQAAAGDNRRQVVELGLPKTVSGIISLELLKIVEHRFPRVTLHLREGMSTDLSEWLRDRRLDAAILFGNQSGEWHRFVPFLEEPLYLVGPPGTFAPGHTVNVGDLGKFPLILPSRTNALHRLVREAAAENGVHLCVKYEIDVTSELLRVVGGGYAFTTLAPIAFGPRAVAGEVSAARIVAPEILRTWAWVERDSCATSAACAEIEREVVSLLRHHTQQLQQTVDRI